MQALDNRVVGAVPEEPGREGRLIERGGTQLGRHGFLQAGQGAVWYCASACLRCAAGSDASAP